MSPFPDPLPNRSVADDSLRTIADQNFARALAESGARDPREFYRQRLKELRERDEQAFRRALDYYDTRLVPAVASGSADALAEWLEYGRVLAQLTTDGQTVQIDRSGRAHPYTPPVPKDHMVLHLPTSSREPALPVGIPSRLSPAQRATFELLVKQALGS